MTGQTAAEKPLNERQRKFAELYAASGNATQSAIGAGYSANGADVAGVRLLGNMRVQAHLTALTEQAQNSRIANVAELREFWTATMRGADHDMKDRLKSSELLGKSMGLFVDKREVSGSVDLGVKYIAGLSEGDI